MDGSQLFAVFGNMRAMMDYRGATITAGPVTRKEFDAEFGARQYAVIVATRADANDPRGAGTILAVLIAPRHDLDTTASKFNSLLESLRRSYLRDCMYGNIIIVTEEPISNALNNKAHAISAAAAEHGRRIVIECHTVDLFCTVTPLHSTVPRHEIVGKAELDELAAKVFLTPDKMPQIRQNDPMAVWHGIRRHMCVKITRNSETGVREVSYRVCV